MRYFVSLALLATIVAALDAAATGDERSPSAPSAAGLAPATVPPAAAQAVPLAAKPSSELPTSPQSDAKPDPQAAPLPTIKEIMNQAHRCRSNYISQVRIGLSQPEVPWTNVEQRSRDLVQMGKYLQRNTPKRNWGEPWERITNVYISHATLLADAAERQDLESAKWHSEKMRALCARCHREHR